MSPELSVAFMFSNHNVICIYSLTFVSHTPAHCLANLVVTDAEYKS
jgi:hypothetical protein